MTSAGDSAVDLTVAGANKRDAGRGIARLSERVRSHLGVLSGDPVRLDGGSVTVVKVWPGEEADGTVRIDADTRANAAVTIGDTVTVSPASVETASSVTVRPATPLPDRDAGRRAIRDRLLDRPVQADERVHVTGLGTVVVEETTPEGPVRIGEDTAVSVGPATGAGESESTTEVVDGPDHPGQDSTVSYEDIGGLDRELELVRETVDLPLAEPERFRRLGVEPPGGVLLYGPPGTGKTLIARAVASEVDAHFEAISGPEIVSKYKGESEERLRDAFERAAENAPSILFVDELDSIAGARDEEADMENRVVAQLLTLMDGLDDRGRVVVIGATNRVDDVDEALRRGGRFDREIEIGVPDEAGRREILEVHTREMPLTDDVDLDALASRTHGFVGADLATLATEAGLQALRRDEHPVVDREDFERALTAVDPSAMREYVAESPTVTFADVGGLDRAKRTLTEAVQWPLQYGPLFDATATDPPSGVLLYGPPGTGKTLLARAIAGETGVNFVHVNGPELLDRYVGESEEAVRAVFDRARRTAPCVVFVDEIDAVAGRRGESHEVTERVVSQFLAELDGLSENRNVVVVAATNRRESLDDALLRPGRLETHVEVPLPDEDGRLEILEVHATGKPLADDVDLADLASETAGHSGAELAALVREASMRAIRDVAGALPPDAAEARTDEVTITAAHLEAALADMVEQ